MDAETRVRLEQMWDTVNTDGWNTLMDDLKEKIRLIKEELALNLNVDQDLLKIAQGRIMAYNDMLTLHPVLDQALSQKEDPDEPDTV